MIAQGGGRFAYPEWVILRALPPGQGYLFARPLDGASAERALRLATLPERGPVVRAIRAA